MLPKMSASQIQFVSSSVLRRSRRVFSVPTAPWGQGSVDEDPPGLGHLYSSFRVVDLPDACHMRSPREAADAEVDSAEPMAEAGAVDACMPKKKFLRGWNSFRRGACSHQLILRF